MNRVESYLFADVDLSEIELALGDWKWRIGASWIPLALSAAGDVFLKDLGGRIARLDTGDGELAPLADSVAEFESACANDANVRDWFLVPLVQELRASGKLLGA